MDHPWQDFLNRFGETLGVAILFGVTTSAFALWQAKDPTIKQGLTVIAAGIIVTAVATAAAHGAFNVHQYWAPCIGAVSGLVAMPLMFAVMKGGRRIEDRADDITDAAVKRVTGGDK